MLILLSPDDNLFTLSLLPGSVPESNSVWALLTVIAS